MLKFLISLTKLNLFFVFFVLLTKSINLMEDNTKYKKT